MTTNKCATCEKNELVTAEEVRTGWCNECIYGHTSPVSEVNFMQVGDGHCFICHKDTKPNQMHAHCVGGKVTDCTREICGDWFHVRYKTKEPVSEVIAEAVKPRSHGLSKTRFYKIWGNMLSRTQNPKCNRYKYYGGRGIKVEWASFDEFKSDMYDAYQEHVALYGEYETTIDRIDTNGNYSKNNCRWATRVEQYSNMRKTNVLDEETARKIEAEYASGGMLREIARKYSTSPQNVGKIGRHETWRHLWTKDSAHHRTQAREEGYVQCCKEYIDMDPYQMGAQALKERIKDSQSKIADLLYEWDAYPGSDKQAEAVVQFITDL